MVLAHADGFSWDEALMVLAPIAVLAGVLLVVNNKLRRGLDGHALDSQDLDHQAADRGTGPADDDRQPDGAARPGVDPTGSS